MCEKVYYPSEKRALLAMKMLQKRGLKIRSVYYCSECKGYHHTSQKKIKR
jgi:hypothetical protein